MTHRAPHDLAQHVAAPLVRRHHAVGDEERHRAQMVGDDAHRDVGRIADGRAVRPAGALADRVEDRREEVGVVVRELALDHRRDALEAHAGVDRRRRQRIQRAVGLAVELHEHVVPDLDVAIAAALEAAAGPPRCSSSHGMCVAAEVVDLRAAAARAGLAHLPEVLGQPELGDAFGGHQRVQIAKRLVVARNAGLALEDRRKEPIGGQAPHARQQLPGERESPRVLK